MRKSLLGCVLNVKHIALISMSSTLAKHSKHIPCMKMSPHNNNDDGMVVCGFVLASQQEQTLEQTLLAVFICCFSLIIVLQAFPHQNPAIVIWLFELLVGIRMQ